MVTAPESQLRPPGYEVGPDHLDEAFTVDGPRELYRPLLEDLGERDLGALASRVQAHVDSLGVGFGDGEGFAVDAVPRLIEAGEWSGLERALEQRARALNAFLLDVYSEQRIFDEGIVPKVLLSTAADYEPRMRGLLSPDAPPAMLAGMDLVRGPAGELAILEDNLRMPSGLTYALAARQAVGAAIDAAPVPRALDGFLESFRTAILAASPRADGDPSAALLSDGPQNSAWYEHRTLGEALGIPVLTPADLECSGSRLVARIEGKRIPLDVIYRRLDEERLTREDGSETPLGELLLPVLGAGTLRCVNAFGTGIADDKLSHAYVEKMIAFYLGEEPLIRSVASLDPSDPAQGAEAQERIDDLVIKPREGFGGHGVIICCRASRDERLEALGALRSRPEGFVAQEMVPLSTHPTISAGRLEPRHVDLRPFIATWAGGQAVLPGGLTRFARDPGEMVVNSSRGGGGKDTWVLEG